MPTALLLIQRKIWYCSNAWLCVKKKAHAFFSFLNAYGFLSLAIGIFGLISMIGYLGTLQSVFRSSFAIERARREKEDYSQKLRILDLSVRERELNVFKDYEGVLQEMEKVTSLKYKTPERAISPISSLK